MLPGLGHPELQNSEQHSSEKGGREDGENQRIKIVIIYKTEYDM